MSNPFAEVPAVRAVPPVEDAEPSPASKYHTVTFKGDELEVRTPSQQALAAFSLATSKYVSSQTRNDMTGLFIQRHLSPESYERVFSRLMDPDDADYSLESIGELMTAVVSQET